MAAAIGTDRVVRALPPLRSVHHVGAYDLFRIEKLPRHERPVPKCPHALRLCRGCSSACPSLFVYRYWIENEIFFRLSRGGMTPEQRLYAEHYRGA